MNVKLFKKKNKTKTFWEVPMRVADGSFGDTMADGKATTGR